VQDIVIARKLAPITMKGISREIVPYVVEGLADEHERQARILSEHVEGLDLHLDMSRFDAAQARRARTALQEALRALEGEPPLPGKA
jgi:adenylate cyclase